MSTVVESLFQLRVHNCVCPDAFSGKWMQCMCASNDCQYKTKTHQKQKQVLLPFNYWHIVTPTTTFHLTSYDLAFFTILYINNAKLAANILFPQSFYHSFPRKKQSHISLKDLYLLMFFSLYKLCNINKSYIVKQFFYTPHLVF